MCEKHAHSVWYKWVLEYSFLVMRKRNSPTKYWIAEADLAIATSEIWSKASWTANHYSVEFEKQKHLRNNQKK